VGVGSLLDDGFRHRSALSLLGSGLFEIELELCAAERGSYELASINYSHSGNRPSGLVLIPVQGGFRNGWVETQSAARALPTFVPTAMSLPAFIHRPILASLAVTLFAQLGCNQAALAARVFDFLFVLADDKLFERRTESFLAACAKACVCFSSVWMARRTPRAFCLARNSGS